jgi:DNA modification methylase
MRRPILNHTKRGELVYEPFLGSGTTLAAAELTERVCYGIELDPKYCDVVRETLAGVDLEAGHTRGRRPNVCRNRERAFRRAWSFSFLSPNLVLEIERRHSPCSVRSRFPA